VVLALGTPADAQTSTGTLPGPAPSLSFVGFGLASGDQSRRARVLFKAGPAAPPTDSRDWWGKVEGGIAISRVIGVGVEVSWYPEVNGDNSPRLGRIQVRDRQRELLVTPLLRAQASRGRQAFAAVAGVGWLRQSRDGTIAGCDPNCFESETSEPLRNSPAFLIGVEYVAALAQHLDIAAAVRLHALRRGSPPASAFFHANSTPLSVSLTLRLRP
jgi:hypothetical protein